MVMATIRDLRLVLTITALSFGVSNAQSLDDSLTLVYRNWEFQKMRIVQLYLDLEEYEKSPFMELYQDYNDAIEILELDYFRLTTHAAGLPDEKRRMATTYLLQNDYILAQVRMQYFRKFQRVLTSRKATDFMQLDDALRTLFRMSIRGTLKVPFPAEPQILTREKRQLHL